MKQKGMHFSCKDNEHMRRLHSEGLKKAKLWFYSKNNFILLKSFVNALYSMILIQGRILNLYALIAMCPLVRSPYSHDVIVYS